MRLARRGNEAHQLLSSVRIEEARLEAENNIEGARPSGGD